MLSYKLFRCIYAAHLRIQMVWFLTECVDVNCKVRMKTNRSRAELSMRVSACYKLKLHHRNKLREQRYIEWK